MDAPVKVWLMAGNGLPSLQVQWKDPATGKRVTRSLHTTDEREGERKRQWYEDRLAQGLPVDEERLTWAAFRQRFLSEHAATLRLPTRKKLATVLNALERHCSPATPRAVDAAMLSRFARLMLSTRIRPGKEGGCAPHTVASYLGDIRTAMAWAKEHGLVRSVPAMPAVRVPTLTPRPVACADYERLSGAVPDQSWRVLLALAWHAGLRLSEAYLLRWSEGDGKRPWLDYGRQRIELPAAFTKAHADRWTPLVPVLLDALAALPRDDERVFLFKWRGGQEMGPADVSCELCRTAKRIGVRIGMQVLRRGFACRLAPKVSMAVLQRALGHAPGSRATLRYYAGVSDEALIEAFRHA